jgi:N-methylhydantoinase B
MTMEPTATAAAPELRTDPITFEVLRNAFKAICNEASALIERVSYAPTITEGHDYSVSILTPDGRLVSHGQRDQAPHMGTFEASIQHLVKEVAEFRPGDVFIYNDPYTGGTHQNDVKIIRPIFSGGEVFAFAIALCHWPDVGGPMHGTFNPHATECYAEGLRMPPLKLYENEVPNKPIWDLIDMNIRVPNERVAERFAQYQAGRLVERRPPGLRGEVRRAGDPRRVRGHHGPFRAPVPRVGPPAARRLVRIHGLGRPGHRPRGPAADQGARQAHHRRRPGDDRLDGLRPGAGGVVGLCPPGAAVGHLRRDHALLPGARAAQPRRRARHQHRLREGHLRRRRGADAGDRLLLGRVREGRLRDHGVLGPGAAEDRSHARPCGDGQPAELLHRRRPPEDRARLRLLPLARGRPGRPRLRRRQLLLHDDLHRGASNQPNETLERWYPMYYTSTEAEVDSCGDGEFRGGFGLSRNFDVWGDTELVVLGDRESIGPPGLAGGTNGGPNILIRNPNSPEEENLGMFTTKALLRKGDRVYFASNGGGGYGLPWNRKAESVLEDVIDELLSLEKARDVYGVAIEAIDPDALEYRIDEEETARLRAALAAADDRPRGTAPFEVNPLGERLFGTPEELGTSDGAPGPLPGQAA